MSGFVTAHLIATEPTGRVDVKFIYDSRAPYEVRLEFVGGLTWVFARELLTDGMYLPSGLGDVVVRPVYAGVELTIQSPSGRAVMVFDRDAIKSALGMTFELVPDGEETIDFDALLKDIA